MPNYKTIVNPYLTVNVLGMAQLDTLPERAEKYFHEALLITVPPAVDAILNNARSQLQPGHGYESGLLHDSLTKEVIQDVISMGVIYSVFSDQADYWEEMEFGFLHKNGTFFPGYHFFANAIRANRGRLGKAAWEAWRMAEARLAVEALVF